MKEIIMIENIERTINSKEFKNLLKTTWNQTQDINLISNLIGELYTINIINKDGYNVDDYINQITSTYLDLHNQKISQEKFDYIKSETITKLIADKLDLNSEKIFTKNEENQIKDYFINEYITNGYVTHAFHDEDLELILKYGFTPGITTDDKQEIKNINLLFMGLGLPAVMGDYPHYDDQTISLNHDLNQTFISAINSPEWFNKFTSSNHNQDFNNIDETPFVLRSEIHCRKNVLNLCYNAGLNLSETIEVMEFYNKYYKKYSSPYLNAGFISKEYINDSYIDKDRFIEQNAISTIKEILLEEKQKGLSNYYVYLSPYDIKLTTIPIADEYLCVNHYKEEKYEDLYNPELNSNVNKKIKHMQNNSKVLKKVL